MNPSSAAPVGSASTSAATCCWTEAEYSTTGGQAAWSETALAQPVNKIVAVPRAISPGFKHPTLRIIGPFDVVDTLGGAPGLLASAPRSEDEKEDSGGQSQPGQCPPPQGGKDGDHRRPRFQSSRRA